MVSLRPGEADPTGIDFNADEDALLVPDDERDLLISVSELRGQQEEDHFDAGGIEELAATHQENGPPPFLRPTPAPVLPPSTVGSGGIPETAVGSLRSV